jgi:hypothetical protein
MKDLNIRSIAKKKFEDELKILQEHAKLAGFRIEASVVDPMEDAIADGPVLVDAKAILRDVFYGNIMLADSLGYNVRIERRVHPLSSRCPYIDIDIWTKRNEDGSYDG